MPDAQTIEATPVLVAMIATGPAMITALAAVFVQNTRIGRRLRTVEDHTSTAAAELTPNHGSSTKDSLNALVGAVEALGKDLNETKAEVGEARKDIGGIREEIRTERKERLDLGQRVTAIERRS